MTKILKKKGLKPNLLLNNAKPRRNAVEDREILKRGAAIPLYIEDIDKDGRGVSRYSGFKILVAGAVTGDRCIARISNVGKSFASATVYRFTELSVLRNPCNPCPDFDTCMGCALLPMRYDEQLRWKHNLVKREFSLFSSLSSAEILEPLFPSRILGYRTTAKLAIAGSYYEPYIGIYRRSSHDVVDLDGCKIHHPAVNSIVNLVRRGINKLRIPVWQVENGTGILRYLVVRVSEKSGEAMVTFVTAKRAFNEIHHLAKFLQNSMPQVKVICQNLNNSEGNVIFGASDRFLTKQRTIRDEIGVVQFEISPRSFLQAQNDGAKLIYEKVAEWSALDGKQTVLDLYCGIGGIAITLARQGARVFGVEINRDAVDDARRNARKIGRAHV